jgi:hypothetical protein
MENTDNYKDLLATSKLYYSTIGSIHCTALKSDVYFTSEGFHHLRYDSSLKERKKPERRNKLSSIPAAVETIKLSSTIQEYRCILEPVGLKDFKGYRTMVKVHYFGFWAVLDYNKRTTRVKAIVRQVNNGQYHFWSVMPYWTELDGLKVFGSVKMQDE